MRTAALQLYKVERVALNFSKTASLEEPPMLLGSAAVRDLDCLTTRVFDSSTRGSGARLDAYREGDTFYIDIDLPGVEPASIDVTFDRKVLIVRAERKPVQREGLRPGVAEPPTGTCTRQVFLSDSLDTDRLDARYDDGVLNLSIPITERVEPGRSAVMSAAA
jgi:HSP20 family protein